MTYKNWKTFWCDRRSRMQHKALIALLFYFFLWGVSISYALTEGKDVVKDGWTIGNILMLCGMVSAGFTGLIGYIFTMTVRGLRADQRRDREDSKEQNEKLDSTLTMIFNDLKKKQDITECHRNMDKLENNIKEG
jgi:hypothetical protein